MNDQNCQPELVEGTRVNLLSSHPEPVEGRTSSGFDKLSLTITVFQHISQPIKYLNHFMFSNKISIRYLKGNRLYFFLFLIVGNCFFNPISAQENSDNLYQKPLKQVLKDVENKFGVTIKFTDSMVQNKVVNYADWRFRSTADETLANVLAPLDMKVNKEGDKRYKLKYYEYYRWTVDDGKEKLDSLATKYNDAKTWETRKNDLRQCMLQALQLSPLPARPASKPILSNKRMYGDYSVENMALEVLPGLYVCGSVYQPTTIQGKIPVILCPDGHFDKGRYRADCQYRCASLARMGCMAISYDLFAWGESLLQFKDEDHRRSIAESIQILYSMRLLDYALSLKEIDANRVAISGGSGGGTLSMLVTALDDRIKLSAPVVSLSCYMYGGCPCESGQPVQFCGGGTDNPEIAAMAAPRPMLIVSDGKDWTDHVPQIEFPYLQKMYSFYNKKDLVQNVHLPNDGHDFGLSKRIPLYNFIAQQFNLDLNKIKNPIGGIDETKVTIEPENAMYAFGKKGENLPANAIKGFDKLAVVFNKATK